MPSYAGRVWVERAEWLTIERLSGDAVVRTVTDVPAKVAHHAVFVSPNRLHDGTAALLPSVTAPLGSDKEQRTVLSVVVRPVHLGHVHTGAVESAIYKDRWVPGGATGNIDHHVGMGQLLKICWIYAVGFHLLRQDQFYPVYLLLLCGSHKRPMQRTSGAKPCARL